MKTMRIAMLGFGNAARAFADILLDKQEQIAADTGFRPVVTAITTASRGSLEAPDGIDLKEACRQIAENGVFDESWSCFSRASSTEVVEKGEYDVVMELTPLNIFTGQPATDHLRKAMAQGKHAVTANKGPVAWYYRELKELARKKGVCFFYETTVMDGAPVFNLVDETLKYCKITEVSGILNTTTNFVLEELARGKEYDAVIKEGQARGFVEADPAMDIEGWDAAAKTAALLNVLMDAGVTPSEVERQGIENITLPDIQEAAGRDKVIKLLCSGKIVNGKVKAVVKPQEIDKRDFLANIEGTSSVVSITTDLMGKLTIVEHDPEILQTGYGVFSDLVRVLDAEAQKP